MIKIIEEKDCLLSQIGDNQIFQRIARINRQGAFVVYERKVILPKEWNNIDIYNKIIPKNGIPVVDIETGELSIIDNNTRVRRIVNATMQYKV